MRDLADRRFSTVTAAIASRAYDIRQRSDGRITTARSAP
jgi:hypothetical protein